MWTKVRRFITWQRLITYVSILFLMTKGFINEQRIKEQYKEIIQLKIETEKLRVNYVVDAKNYDKIKKPLWRSKKIGEGYMVDFVNQTYEDMYLIPYNMTKYDVVGKTNDSLFSYTMANTYNKNNDIALSSAKPLDFIEPFIYPDGEFKGLRVTKWAEIADGNNYVWGMSNVKYQLIE